MWLSSVPHRNGTGNNSDMRVNGGINPLYTVLGSKNCLIPATQQLPGHSQKKEPNPGIAAPCKFRSPCGCLLLWGVMPQFMKSHLKIPGKRYLFENASQKVANNCVYHQQRGSNSQLDYSRVYLLITHIVCMTMSHIMGFVFKKDT